MKRYFPKLLGAALIGAAIASSPAAAAVTAAQRAACTPDVFRICSSEIPDVPAIIACLKGHRSALSGACRTVLDEAARQQQATRGVIPKVEWCGFPSGAPASDDKWREWCGEKAWTPTP